MPSMRTIYPVDGTIPGLQFAAVNQSLLVAPFQYHVCANAEEPARARNRTAAARKIRLCTAMLRWSKDRDDCLDADEASKSGTDEGVVMAGFGLV